MNIKLLPQNKIFLIRKDNLIKPLSVSFCSIYSSCQVRKTQRGPSHVLELPMRLPGRDYAMVSHKYYCKLRNKRFSPELLSSGKHLMLFHKMGCGPINKEFSNKREFYSPQGMILPWALQRMQVVTKSHRRQTSRQAQESKDQVEKIEVTARLLNKENRLTAFYITDRREQNIDLIISSFYCLNSKSRFFFFWFYTILKSSKPKLNQNKHTSS